MILIADSGSTKTGWVLLKPSGDIVHYQSVGLNPYHTPNEIVLNVLRELFPDSGILSDINELHFYGAGCKLEPMNQQILEVLSSFFVHSTVHVYSDILGAARSLHSQGKGLVAILGTGVNSAFYNGNTLRHGTPSLGFILGDEGSGCYLGKELIRHWQYGDLPKELSEALADYSGHLSLSEILSKVFDRNSERFLSGFVPFMVQWKAHPVIKRIVDNAFDLFVKRHLCKYPEFSEYPTGVVGSVGFYFSDRLKLAVEQKGGTIGRVIQYPIEGLISFHGISHLH